MPCEFHLALLIFKLGNNLRMYFLGINMYIYIYATHISIIDKNTVYTHVFPGYRTMVNLSAGGVSILHAIGVFFTPITHIFSSITESAIIFLHFAYSQINK